MCVGGCDPSCAGAECGYDPVCGVVWCGFCDGEYETCVDNRCISTLGDNCDDCESDSECLPGYICDHWDEYPEAGNWCAAPCSSDAGCPENMHCDAGTRHCAPDISQGCYHEEAVWWDSCGHWLYYNDCSVGYIPPRECCNGYCVTEGYCDCDVHDLECFMEMGISMCSETWWTGSECCTRWYVDGEDIGARCE
ncbi:MAG: hypothetical protein JXR96_22170 [Deltaproteobacteria bacterium]|nr:hypothetical protein [Deltaproteobacteria bacterium]